MLFTICASIYALSLIVLLIFAYLEQEESIGLVAFCPIINAFAAFIFIAMYIEEEVKKKKTIKEKEQELLSRGIYRVVIDNKTYEILENELFG